MAPSRKIFIGSTLLVTGFLISMGIELLLFWMMRGLGSVAEGEAPPSAQALERNHWLLLASGTGQILALAMIFVGGIVLLVAAYQTARAVERLQAQRSPGGTGNPIPEEDREGYS